jgi:hypothetical protein
MHGGIVMALRRYMIQAKPRQQTLIYLALIVGGVALVMLGVHAGVVLMLAGLLFARQLLNTHHRLRGVRSDGESPSSTTPDE